MRIHLVGNTADENASNQFEVVETMLKGLYPGAEIFNPIRHILSESMKNKYLKTGTQARQNYDAFTFSACIQNLGTLTDKDNDFVVAVNSFDDKSLAYAEKIFCKKYNILYWQKSNKFWVGNEDGIGVGFFFPLPRSINREFSIDPELIKNGSDIEIAKYCSPILIESRASGS